MRYRIKQLFCIIALIVLINAVSLNAEEQLKDYKIIHHNIKVKLYPKEQRFAAEDLITVPEHFLLDVKFQLHKGLKPSSITSGVTISLISDTTENIAESFRVKLPPGQNTFVLRYGGSIYHPIETVGKEQARGFKDTHGLISEDGAYLAGSSCWYPSFNNALVTFTLQIELPPDWDAVSQGERILHVIEKDKTRVDWESTEFQDEIFLIAAKFKEYTQQAGKVSAMAFLRTPDNELANKYLDATARYLTMYEKLIGPYPYKKFALVENFWETGLGMPSFTLLGPKIIRFPFIINSSYPHEILHNWWGNSVFSDYDKGNWSEGLTAYLSDHLIKEQQGSGAEYRQTTLQKYADYVSISRDFPLIEFRSRYSSPSEAIGYGKSLMFFHMIRQRLGDKAFISGLQDFYMNNRFKKASFSELEKSFEKVSGLDLRTEFDQWLSRSGAPKIRLINIKSKAEGSEYILTATIEQTQPENSYLLYIPFAVTLKGQKQAYQTMVVMDKKHLDISFRLPSMPLRVDVDPEFDLFRRLDLNEIHPAISQALGAEKMLIILPSSASNNMIQAYQEFAETLSNSGPDRVEIKLDNEMKTLPSNSAITILGWENNFFKEILSALSVYDLNINQKIIRIGKTEFTIKNSSVVFASRNPEKREMPIMFVASDSKKALSGLGRKLPHYHKYSYLIFEGEEPVNIAKGRWPVFDSPMTTFIPDKDGKYSKIEMGALTLREPLATLPLLFSEEKMMDTIRFLSGDDLKGRGLGTEGLDLAAVFIADKFKEAGLKSGGDEEGSYFQIWEERIGDQEQRVKMKNAIGIIPGNKPEFSGQSIVIGAHYDHLGLGWPDVRGDNKGKIHPGADDNASGVSVLIELARILSKNLNPDRSVVFVAFTGEETGKNGSRHYLATYKHYPVDKIKGMLNLDTVGRLKNKKLLVLGAGSAKEWVHIFRGVGYVTGVEIEAVSEELDSSDQKGFQDAGIPAVQLFSGPHLDYHRPTDSADKIDPDGLLKVASVAKEIIEYLAARKEPLTIKGEGAEKNEPTIKKERKVSIGTIPDFAFDGKGCRIIGVVPGSPAETCGLKDGDVIIRINSTSINSLKDLSQILKELSPGKRISITFERDDKEFIVETEVVEK